jgi:hypothetical protein
MHSLQEFATNLTRRHFFGRTLHALGWGALATLLSRDQARAAVPTHHQPRARHVIFLHMVGGPSQMDLLDHKPAMADWFDKTLPDSVRMGQRLTTPSRALARLAIVPSKYQFQQYGRSGAWVSELLPWTAKMVDDLCIVRSLHTEAINHDPAITFLQTGNQLPGRPCLGAWTAYGLGSLNQDLPTFVVLQARPSKPTPEATTAIGGRLWQAGYLPGEFAGVPLRPGGDPILFLNNPPGVSADVRRLTLDGIKTLNEMQLQKHGDAEIATRMASYEMAYRMQTSAPELVDLTKEPKATFELYGAEARQPGTFAHTALLARRLVERGVRFVQVYHNNWDTHKRTAKVLPTQCRDVDQACYGLIQDLKARGLLQDTLVIWGGEFGRTIYSEGAFDRTDYGRDHHPRCFTMWLAGGGAKAGLVHGETDEFGYNTIKDPVHIRDLHATLLHLLGFDHKRLSVNYQGLDQRLTGVEPATVVKELLA